MLFCTAHYFCAMDNDDCAMTMEKIPKPPISLTPGHTLISNTPLPSLHLYLTINRMKILMNVCKCPIPRSITIIPNSENIYGI